MDLLKEYEVRLEEDPVSEAGSGAYGVVYRSRLNGARCAVKRIHEILLGSGNYESVDDLSKNSLVGKFVREIEFLKSQRHPNIVQFLGVCILDGNSLENVAMVMEHMDTSLKDLIEDCSLRSINTGLSLGNKISILKDVACGMSHLHSQDIIHRDLNAGNVLLSSSLQAKVADLGIARVFPRSLNAPAMSLAPGAMEFMPPEALKQDPVYGLKLDCFSFGHLSLCLLIEDYPRLNDASIDDVTYEQAITDNKLEILRRKSSFDRLGEDHPLRFLLVSCMNDSPTHRPMMKVIRETLDGLLTAMEYQPVSFIKLQQENYQLNQELLSSRQSLRDSNNRLQEITNELTETRKLMEIQLKDSLASLKERDSKIQEITTEKQKELDEYISRCRSQEAQIESLKQTIERSTKNKAPILRGRSFDTSNTEKLLEERVITTPTLPSTTTKSPQSPPTTPSELLPSPKTVTRTPSTDKDTNTSSTAFNYATRRRSYTMGIAPATAPKPSRNSRIRQSGDFTTLFERSQIGTDTAKNNETSDDQGKTDFRELLRGRSFRARWMTNAQEIAQTNKAAEEEIKRNRQQELDELIQARESEMNEL